MSQQIIVKYEGMNITIHVDENGDVIFTDLPEEMLDVISALADYDNVNIGHCEKLGITGFSAYSECGGIKY